MEDALSKGEHPVDARLPNGKLLVLGLQHVMVMYAGAVAVPLIIGNALKLESHEIAMLISADLFCCGLVTLIQSLGLGRWFGIKLPVMMGVTFASVGPMMAIATNNPGMAGANLIFGSIIGAGIVAILIAPLISRMLRFFPPVVTGTIIAVIGINLMRVGINWIFGNPVGPTAPMMVDPINKAWLDIAATQVTSPMPPSLNPAPTIPNPRYADVGNLAISAAVMVVILLIVRFMRGFLANIAVLMGIVVGCVIAAAAGMMRFDKVAKADWVDVVLPFHFGMPVFDPIMILTMSLVMVVVMIESTGMFLALGDMTEKKISRSELSKGLRTDGLGTLIGGIFNTFPYTSFSQNVGLVAITGVKSRYVCVAGGLILLVLGLLPKMGALVESIPMPVLGGAGIVMFGMVAATGVRILSGVDFKNNHYNSLIIAISIGAGMIPLVAPNFKQWLPHAIHPLIESGILLASITAVLLNLYFNGAGKKSTEDAVAAAKQADTH
ncbi:nucleobase:cation symporter-2 family protein [Snodgrassella sp. CFCC 13594]|uniref:nucleobase:cation symporter-2 family protein n=1 Tax=Snodgrassella sp. CFCC 13594 TaxID=1775559 RepID=UPI000835F0CF|nr:nucleobase:cation symporter-2 family protein [Snodgrassella sp. CFCC 13594]